MVVLSSLLLVSYPLHSQSSELAHSNTFTFTNFMCSTNTRSVQYTVSYAYQLDIFDMHCSKLFKISCLSSTCPSIELVRLQTSFIVWYTLYSTQNVVSTCSACDNKNLYRKVNVVCGHVTFLEAYCKSLVHLQCSWFSITSFPGSPHVQKKNPAHKQCKAGLGPGMELVVAYTL